MATATATETTAGDRRHHRRRRCHFFVHHSEAPGTFLDCIYNK